MCMREYEGLTPCKVRWPSHPVHWCPECRAAWEARWSELFSRWDLEAREAAIAASHVAGDEPDPPCPLDSAQVEHYQAWLAAGDMRAWTYQQITTVTPN